MAEAKAQPASAPTAKLDELLDDNSRVEELSSTSEEADNGTDSDNNANDHNAHDRTNAKEPPAIPAMFLHPSYLEDELVTISSEAQKKVRQVCMELLSGQGQTITEVNSHGIPRLQRRKHAKFLRDALGPYPSQFAAMDASRPWMIYWALAGLSFLGEDVSRYRQRTIDTFMPLQNADGGFGGGHGQLSHCAPSYAATLSLALVDGLDMIDRRIMWQYLGSMKQANGGFTMAEGGEMDVRGAYCSLVIISLLNLPLDLPRDSPAKVNGDETFLTNLGEWFGQCQTFEGGIGAAPDNEAHGSYAFCCLAGLSLIDAPHVSIPKYLDVGRMLSWLSARQSAPEGSLSGRTNKLVDACYSHWVGSCWSILQAALQVPQPNDLWDRQGLVRYTLCCSQNKGGGLRDKPGTRPDAYHTCYSLAGLSAAQNIWIYEGPDAAEGEEPICTNLRAAFGWRSEIPNHEQMDRWAFDEEDRLVSVHPVFVVPADVVEKVKRQFEHVSGF